MAELLGYVVFKEGFQPVSLEPTPVVVAPHYPSSLSLTRSVIMHEDFSHFTQLAVAII